MLVGFTVDAVDLRGISRRIYVGAEESGDVRADVMLIRDNIEDGFQVAEVRIRRPRDDETLAGMKVDYTEMTVAADRAPSPRLSAFGLLGTGRRRPPGSTDRMKVGRFGGLPPGGLAGHAGDVMLAATYTIKGGHDRRQRRQHLGALPHHG